MTTTVVDMTIPAGLSGSGSVDCTQGATNSTVVALYFPDEWNSSGGLTFQISSDNVTYYDVYEADGREKISAVKPGGALLFGADFAKAATWLRIRSGTRDVPVNQTADRVFKVVLVS